MRRILIATWLALACVLSLSSAHAAALGVFTVEHGAWGSAVAALQSRLDAQGSTVHVYVLDALGTRAPCGTYSLALDAAGSAAFAPGACDPVSQATALRLVDRASLFDHDGDDALPSPRAIAVTAREVREAVASGGARAQAGSQVTCSAAVRPYVRDLEHGGVVYLEPGRFVLRVRRSDVSVSPEPVGFVLRRDAAGTRGALSIEYDVLDARRGNAVVLHDRATLACGAVSADTAPIVPEGLPAPDEPPPTVPTVDVRVGAHVTIERGTVRIRGGAVHIARGGSLVIRNGGALVIGGGGEAEGEGDE